MFSLFDRLDKLSLHLTSKKYTQTKKDFPLKREVQLTLKVTMTMSPYPLLTYLTEAIQDFSSKKIKINFVDFGGLKVLI
jgi:hypothetical protein